MYISTSASLSLTGITQVYSPPFSKEKGKPKHLVTLTLPSIHFYQICLNRVQIPRDACRQGISVQRLCDIMRGIQWSYCIYVSMTTWHDRICHGSHTELKFLLAVTISYRGNWPRPSMWWHGKCGTSAGARHAHIHNRSNKTRNFWITRNVHTYIHTPRILHSCLLFSYLSRNQLARIHIPWTHF